MILLSKKTHNYSFPYFQKINFYFDIYINVLLKELEIKSTEV